MIFDDLRSIIIERMKVLRMPIDRNWDTNYLCIKYYDTIRRFCFFQSPVTIHSSSEIKRKMLNDTEKKALENICSRLETGRPIFPYLSRSINNTNIKKSDFCMKNWNIFHTHLGRLPENSMQCHRSDRLLFFTHNNNNVYLIDVKKHPKGSEWFDKELILIIYRNWPELLHPVSCIKPADKNTIPDESYFELSKHVIIPIQIEGKFYMPTNFGVATSGDSQIAVEQTDLFFMELSNFSSCILRDMGDRFFIYEDAAAAPIAQISNIWSQPFL